MLGLCAIVLGEDGLVWNMRLLNDGPLARKYGYSEAASAAAPGKMGEVVGLIDARLEAQEQRGSQYIVGDSVTAIDVYWATFSICVMPTPREIMPLTRQNKAMMRFFESNAQIPEIAAALSDRIRDHQRYILTTYCETPAVLGGDPLESG